MSHAYNDAIFRITGFADEVSSDLDTQIQTFHSLQLKAIDVRRIGGRNVLDLSDEELRDARDRASGHGIDIQSVGSPVNKVACTPDNRVREDEKLRVAINAAHSLGVRRIRIFSPEVGMSEHATRAGEVLEWMASQVEMATAANVVLIHENDAKFWGAYPQNSQRLFELLGGEHFRAAFDFANTVLLGFRPFPDWFPWLLPHLDTIHIKDAVESDQKVVPAGEGDGQIAQTLRFLIAEGWSGPLTLEPHLQAVGPLGGFSGPQLFAAAATALRAVLAEVGANG